MTAPTRLFDIGLLAFGLAGFALVSQAQAKQVYCYASEMDRSGDKVSRTLNSPEKFFVSPIFDSDEDIYLLQAKFGAANPNVGGATCITDEDQSDLPADRQQLIDGINADGGSVVIQSIPASPTKPSTRPPKIRKCAKGTVCTH